MPQLRDTGVQVKVVDDAGNTVGYFVRGNPGFQVLRSREDIRLAAAGLLTQNAPRAVMSSSSSLTAGVRYLVGEIAVRANETITGIAVEVVTAAVGTAPTSVVLALVDPATNKVVALTAELKSDAQLTVANTEARFPLASPLVNGTSDRVLYVGMLQVGSFGTTQPTFARGSANAMAAFSGEPWPFATAGTGTTAWPAVAGTALTLAAGSSIGFWAGLY